MQSESNRSHWWPTFGVLLGVLTIALNIGVLNIAIPSMMSSLGSDLARIQWVQTGYQIAQVVMIPAVVYPMGTEQATEAIRDILVQDGLTGGTLRQMTNAVLRQQLGERAAMASYHDLVAMFAILAIVCLVPILLLRTRPKAASRKASTSVAVDAGKEPEASGRR